MNHPAIRNAEAGDYQAIINVLDEWWGGRQMALISFHCSSNLELS